MSYPFSRFKAQRQRQRQARRRRLHPPSALSSLQADPLLVEQPEHRDRAPSPRGHVELLETISVGKNVAYEPPQATQPLTSSLVPYKVSTGFDEPDDDEFVHSIQFPLPQTNLRYNRNPAVDLAVPFISHGCCCCQCVRTQEVGFTEECGRFERILSPGFYCMLWPYSSVAGRLSLRIQQLDVTCETKTVDSVFCHVTVAVLFRVAVLKAYQAFYTLTDPCLQIQACVLDVVRSAIPSSMTMDELFENKREIADQVFVRLARDMLDYGYEITSTLVTDITPNAHVKASMNEINASRRIKEAASHKAEAQKVSRIYQAQADAETDFMHGVGIAKQRKAIVQGMQESIQMWTEMDVRVIDPPDQKQIMNLLLITQYLDTLEAVSSDDLYVMHGPAELKALQQSVRS